MQNETLLNIVLICGAALMFLALIALVNGMNEAFYLAISGGIVSLLYCAYEA